MITTTIGSWTNFADGLSVEWSVAEALGDFGGEYDQPAICAEYRAAIDGALEELPFFVQLVGDEFIAEWQSDYGTDDIREAIEGVDLWNIVGRQELQSA